MEVLAENNEERKVAIKEFRRRIEDNVADLKDSFAERVSGIRIGFREMLENIGIVDSDDFESLYGQDGGGFEDEELERMLMEDYTETTTEEDTDDGPDDTD